MKKYIDFSVDYDGNCESVDEFIVNGGIVNIGDESNVQPLIEKLQGVDGFYLSEHRTEVRVWWNKDGTMDVRYRDYTEPDCGIFDDHELFGLSPIEFESELG